jgi:hypothetical protein
MTEDVRVKSHIRGGFLVPAHTRKKRDTKQIAAGAGGAALGAGAVTLISTAGKPEIHEVNPATVYKQFEDLMPKLRPGDVLVTGEKDTVTTARTLVGLGTGNIETYHSVVVKEVTPKYIDVYDMTSAGQHTTRYMKDGRVFYPDKVSGLGAAGFHNGSVRNISAFRSKDPAVGAAALRAHERRYAAVENIQKALVRRGLTETQAQDALKGLFHNPEFARQAVDELWTPFFKAPEPGALRQVYQSREAAIATLEGRIDDYADQIMAKVQAGKKGTDALPKDLRAVCSSAVATSGFPVHGKKDPRRASPADTFRSPDVEAIGHFRPDVSSATLRTRIRVMKLAPYGIRAATGLIVGGGLGLGTYAVYKKVKARNTTPPTTTP